MKIRWCKSYKKFLKKNNPVDKLIIKLVDKGKLHINVIDIKNSINDKFEYSYKRIPIRFK